MAVLKPTSSSRFVEFTTATHAALLAVCILCDSNSRTTMARGRKYRFDNHGQRPEESLCQPLPEAGRITLSTMARGRKNHSDIHGQRLEESLCQPWPEAARITLTFMARGRKVHHSVNHAKSTRNGLPTNSRHQQRHQQPTNHGFSSTVANPVCDRCRQVAMLGDLYHGQRPGSPVVAQLHGNASVWPWRNPHLMKAPSPPRPSRHRCRH